MFNALHRFFSTSSWTVRGRVNQLHEKVDRLTEAVDQLLDAQKQDEKWRSVFRRQMNAVIRHFYLETDVPAPYGLAGQRFRLRSQNEEDGIILALMKAGGASTRKFVEIGSGSTGGNAATLAADFGWSGLMVDASRKAIEQAKQTFAFNPGVVAVRAMVTPETINSLIETHGFAGEIDLLSIDVDSIDYWLLEAVTVCRPRVLIMEYNALFGPSRAVSLPNAPKPDNAPKGYSGASLAAIEKLARRKGYRLVLCEESGINAFFLRHDVAPAVPGLAPEQAYRPWIDKHDVTGLKKKDIDIDDVIRQSGLPLVEV
ncbi:MAG: class I SAM-dependent methyltransferase [Acidobacteriota bacterium]